LGGGGGVIAFAFSEEFPGSFNGGSKVDDFEFMCVGKEVCAVLFQYICFKGFFIWFNHSLRVAKRGLLLISFVLAAMVSLRAWMSVRRVFASGVGFVCLCPRGCFMVAAGVWRGCEC